VKKGKFVPADRNHKRVCRLDKTGQEKAREFAGQKVKGHRPHNWQDDSHHRNRDSILMGTSTDVATKSADVSIGIALRLWRAQLWFWRLKTTGSPLWNYSQGSEDFRDDISLRSSKTSE
jgi:hypothetical protein